MVSLYTTDAVSAPIHIATAIEAIFLMRSAMLKTTRLNQIQTAEDDLYTKEVTNYIET